MRRSQARELAVTHSSWINAYTLRRACARIGVDLRVSAPFSPASRDLPLPVLQRGHCAQWLCFTEEASLRLALGAESAASHFLPKHFPLELLDDKWAFARHLMQDPQGPQPLKIWGISDPAQLPFPVVLKARHSWVAGRKLPRGWVCRSKQELDTCLARLHENCLQPEWFYLQEWLGDAPLQLLSVAGFFDSDDETRNLEVVTERIAAHEYGMSCTAMLATVEDAWGLVEKTHHILRRLAYRGPYELEFIVSDGKALVLEINPRFWMQHGLFLESGNGLVERYFGVENMNGQASQPPKNMLWIDGIWLMRNLLHFNMKPLLTWSRWKFQGYRAVIFPKLGYVLWAGIWRIFKRTRHENNHFA